MSDDDPIPDDEVARRRDQTIRRMFATPPKPHKDSKRRQTPSAKVTPQPKRRTNKKKDSA